MLLEKIMNCRRRSWRELLRRAEHYEWRNAISHACRIRKANARAGSA